jgi:hypothetical protein
MSATYEISPESAADIPELKAAFLSLHDDHRALSAVPLTEPRRSCLGRTHPHL